MKNFDIMSKVTWPGLIFLLVMSSATGQGKSSQTLILADSM